MSKGKFVWHELCTTDVDGGKAFYSEVIGWKAQKTPNMDYTMLLVGDAPSCGLMLLPEEAKKAGALGGAVHVPPMDIPVIGKFAVCADPQGAVFGVFQPADTDGRERATGTGSVTWNELNTTDWESGWKFYVDLFGWETTEDMDMGPEMGTYHMFKHAGSEQPVGGMSNAAKMMEGMPPHWLYYVSVDDLDAAVGRVKSNGGKILNGPMEVPGGDRIVQCMDPQGAAFALHWTKR